MTRSLMQLFRIRSVSFLISLAALACLPWALTILLRGVDLKLLLPITLLGILTAQGLSALKAKRTSAWVILLIFGPLVLIARLGGLWNSLLTTIENSFAVVEMLFYRQPVDASVLLFAREELVQKSLGLGVRFVQWASSFLHGTDIDDPVIRTLVWCLLLWLAAVWAGGQFHQPSRSLVGIFPTTLLLALAIHYTGREIKILWLHLGLLLLLVGLTSFSEQMSRWDDSKTDYSESTTQDTLLVVVVLTIILTTFSSFVSSVSVKDIIEKIREARTQTISNAQAEALGLKPVQGNTNITGTGRGLPRSHLIIDGPDLSQQLVMTISTGELPPMPPVANVAIPRHYWRTLTYQVYNGTGWSNPTAFGSEIAPDEKLVNEIPPGYRVLTQSVTFSNETVDRLYWAGTLQSANVPFEAAWLRKAGDTPLLSSHMLAALASPQSYQAQSLILDVDVESLRESPNTYPDWVRRHFLSLPQSVPARVHKLARELTASASTPYDRALAIESYLRTFPYTLDVSAPPLGYDAADYFLFDLQKGYCDYYATSMVVLARAAGLPARLVVGYASGGYDFESARYLVTENYAHSWVEIYFTNIGWVEFEPTSNMPLVPHEETNVATASEPEAQPAERSFAENLAPLLQRIWTRVWLPILALLIFGPLWIGYDSFRLARLDPSQTAQLLYRRLRRLALPVTGYASSSQTAHAYAFALTQQLSSIKISPRFQHWLAPAPHEIRQLTELFSRSLFAPLPPTRADAEDALKNWSHLRWRLLLASVLVIQNGKTQIKG